MMYEQRRMQQEKQKNVTEQCLDATNKKKEEAMQYDVIS